MGNTALLASLFIVHLLISAIEGLVEVPEDCNSVVTDLSDRNKEIVAIATKCYRGPSGAIRSTNPFALHFNDRIALSEATLRFGENLTMSGGGTMRLGDLHGSCSGESILQLDKGLVMGENAELMVEDVRVVVNGEPSSLAELDGANSVVAHDAQVKIFGPSGTKQYLGILEKIEALWKSEVVIMMKARERSHIKTLKIMPYISCHITLMDLDGYDADSTAKDLVLTNTTWISGARCYCMSKYDNKCMGLSSDEADRRKWQTK